MIKEQIAILLLGRQYWYNLLQLVFGQEPSEELLVTFNSEATREAFQIFFDDENLVIAGIFKDILSFEEKRKGEPDKSLEETQSDYTKLFIGPHELLAPPWECVYTGNHRMLFQKSTLVIRELYRSEGFLPAEYPHVSDDHISLELDFMNRLAQKCLQAFEQEDEESYRHFLQVQYQFLTEHLLKWVSRYTDDISRVAEGSFYAIVGRLLNEFIKVDKTLVEELLEL